VLRRVRNSLTIIIIIITITYPFNLLKLADSRGQQRGHGAQDIKISLPIIVQREAWGLAPGPNRPVLGRSVKIVRF